ncbi:MAG: hypothetical protein ACK6DP_08520 [Gemmatimonas sp.]|jgi:hypothetical protein|uniref:hypothetical protein n=1 Tax=Gemmatimonas sp. TaxID=1962908 RepID=UPI00391F32C7|nr:hypothetical protein [Gemmatimonadota bacterium]
MGNTLSARPIGAPRIARRALSFLALIVTVGGLVACGDNSNLLSPANSENTTRSFSVFALSGSPSALPAAYKFTSETLERPQVLSNGAVNFDVAFDITAENRVAILPVRVVVPLPPAGAPVVGLQRSDAAFSALERAPTRGYVNDTTLVVTAGQTVLVQLQGAGCFLGDPYYAKLVVDSIVVPERRLVVRSLVNRNCGYRALTEGLPKN